MAEDKILKECLTRWKFAYEADTDQREQEREDLAFQVPDNQWTLNAKKERDKNHRPRLSISQLDQPAQLVLNQERAARFGVNVHALSPDATDDTADIIQGLYRHIERDSQASQARSWGFRRAVLAGRGYWRVRTEYDEDSGNPFDQKILIEPIYYQNSVVWDPASTRPDRSDAEYVFVETWLDEDSFKRMWPKAKVPQTLVEHEQYATQAPGWAETQGEKRSYRVVEYIYKEHVKETIVMLADGSVVPEKQAPDGAKLMTGPDGEPLRRERDSVEVWICKVSGCEVLETTKHNGKYIPIVTVIGRELTPFDSKRRFVGIINHSKDGQRFFNMAASTYLERMAMEPKAPIIGYVGQFEGLEDEWDEMNTRNLTRLEVNPTVDPITKQVLPLPQRMQVDMSGVGLAGQALQTARSMIQSTTTVFDPSLGRTDEERSGKAIMALQQQADASTSDFMQQMGDAMQYEAKVVLDIMPRVYDRPGRVTRILRGDDDKAESVMLNRPHMLVNGRPVEADGNAANVKHFDLRRGGYGVSITIGKSFQTRLEHGAEFMADVITRMPQFLPLLGDLVFRYRDDPGAKEIAERLAKVREKEFPGLGEGEDGNIPPEQMQAQMQGLKQQLEAQGQEMQAMVKALETDQAKQQAAIAKAQMDTEAKIRIASEKNQTDIAIAQQNNETKLAIENLAAQVAALVESKKGAQDLMSQHQEHAHEAGIQAEDHRHEDRKQIREFSHDVGMAAAGGNSIEFRREGGQESGSERSDEQSRGSNQGRAMGGDEGNQE